MNQQASTKEQKTHKQSQECEKCDSTNEENPFFSDLILCSWWIWMLDCLRIKLPKLKCVHQMPAFCQERYITRYYRPIPSSLFYTIKSVLLPTNETMNFWTHFLPLIYLLFHHYNVIMEILNGGGSFIHNAKAHIFAAYSLGCCAVFGFSSLAHLFNCISKTGRHVCFFCDYGGISLFGYGAAVAYYYVVLPPICYGFGFTGHYLYLSLATLSGIGCHIACCHTRFPLIRFRHALRTLAPLVSYVTISLPVFARYIGVSGCDVTRGKTMFNPTFLSACPDERYVADEAVLLSSNLKCNIQSDFIPHEGKIISNLCSDLNKFSDQFCLLNEETFQFYFFLHISSFVLAAVIKSSRFPECVFPGRFDVIGNSHQLFHIVVAIAIIAHSFLVEDAILDSIVPFGNTNEVSIWWSCGLMAAFSVVLGVIVFIYGRWLSCE